MELLTALQQARETRRSKTFIFACKARELPGKLLWLIEYHGGNKSVGELVK